MERCPKCKRFGVEYDSSTGKERCCWIGCSWVNEDKTNLKTYNYGLNFREFYDKIKKKEDFAQI